MEDHNAGGYSNPEFDRLADQLVAETDVAAAQQQVFKMQEFLADELPLYYPVHGTPIVETYRSEKLEFPYTDNLGGLQNGSGFAGPGPVQVGALPLL